MQAFEGYTNYINPVLADRKATGSTDDLVGVLCQAEIDGDSLDEASLIHETLLILIGGDETTRHVISGGMEELLAQPEQLAQLPPTPRASCPAPSRRCCAGCRRSRTWPARPPRRRARGATIKEGQELLLLYASANRDESVFDEPDTFDITRNPNPHIAFGFGAHFCLGNQLARLELKVMFERLLARMPDIHLAAGATRCRAVPLTSSPASSPCRWNSRPAAPGLPGHGLMTSTTPAAGIAGWSILVTGGGSGIGLTTAERFAADGAHVAVCGPPGRSCSTRPSASPVAPGAHHPLHRGGHDGRGAGGRGRAAAAEATGPSTGCSPVRAVAASRLGAHGRCSPRCAATIDLDLAAR